MANPFDQFDAPASSANPFDQFDARPAGEGMPSARQPTKEARSWGETAVEAVGSAPGSIAHFAKGALDVGAGALRNTAQAVLPTSVFNAIDPADADSIAASEAARAALDMPAGAIRNLAKSAAENAPNTILGRLSRGLLSTEGKIGDKATAERASEVANAVGEHYKGYLDPETLKERIATDPASVAADISLLSGFMKRGATAANMPRAAETLGTVEKYTNPMLPVQAAVPPIVNTLAKGYDAGTNVLAKMTETARAPFTPLANVLVPAMEGQLPEAVTALRNAKPGLPGSPATAAEVLVGEGFKGTQFPALQQDVLRAQMPTEAEAIAARQREAQRGAIQTIGGTPADLEAAQTARAEASTAAYRKALAPIVSSDTALQTLMETPAMQKALPAAAERANNRGREFRIGEDVPAYETPSALVGAKGEPIMRTVEAEYAQYPGQALHDIKISLDNMLEKKSAVGPTGETSLSKSQLADVKNVRDQFVTWMEDKLPKYKEARQQHAAASRDIDVRRVGQQLEGALTSPLNENVSRAAQFAGAVENAPSTIKKATGDARFSDLSQILETGDSLKVAQVLGELSRTAEYKRLAGLGKAQAKNALIASELPAVPNQLGWVRSAASRIMNKLEGKINEKTARTIAEASLNPAVMATLLEKAAAQAARTEQIGNKIRAQKMTGGKALTERAQNITNALRRGGQISNTLALQEAP